MIVNVASTAPSDETNRKDLVAGLFRDFYESIPMRSSDNSLEGRLIYSIFTDKAVEEAFIFYVKSKTNLTIQRIWSVRKPVQNLAASYFFVYDNFLYMVVEIEEDKFLTEYLLRE